MSQRNNNDVDNIAKPLLEDLGKLPDNLGDRIELSLDLAKKRLVDFADEPNFENRMRLAFGEDSDVSDLRQTWKATEINFPEIEVRSAAEINGANGAYSIDTNKIYLAHEFLVGNDTEAIANLLLEEYGHYVDALINSSDASGDEGAIFAALVNGKDLSNSELQQLKGEDDTAVVSIDDESVAIEANADLDLVASGLDGFFNTLQNAVSSEVFGNELPLFGDSLKDSNVASLRFIDDIRSRTIGQLQQLSNPTARDIANTLNR